MDIEELENLSVNATGNDTNITELLDQDYEHDSSFYARLFLELFTVVTLLSVVANFFICFVIIKYKKLRKDVTNILILHMCIVQILYLICTPMTLRLFEYSESPVGITVFCIVNEAESVLLLCVFFFLILLVADWYIKTYTDNKYIKFQHIYKFLVALIYIITIFIVSLTTQFCISSYYFFHFTLIIVFLLYLLMVIFMIIMNIIHKVKQRRLINKVPNNVGLALTNIFMLAWLPLLAVMIFSILGYHIVVLMICASTICFTSPIFNFLYLYRYENNFNIFLTRVFRCECNEYKNESLEDSSVTYNDVNGVQIPEQTHPV